MTENDWQKADAIATAVLAAHGGVARIDAFLEAGLSRRQIAAIFRRGVMERPRNAWFVDPALPWQAKRAVRVGGVADCVTSAELWGLPVPLDAHKVIHIHVDEHDTRLRHNRDKTWTVHAGDDHETCWHRRALVDPAVWRTSLVDTLLQLAWCVSLDWLVVVLDAALHRPRDGSREPLLASDEYDRFVRLLPKRFHGALPLVDPRAESLLESLLRLAMWRRGLGPVEPQVWAHPSHQVDFLLRGKLVVEADGARWHDPVKDAARDALLRSLGYVVLRLTYAEIMFEIDAALDRIEAALASI